MKFHHPLSRFPSLFPPSIFSSARWIAAVMLVLVMAGCGNNGNPHPVNAVKARELLKTTMEAWKSGKKPEEMSQGNPSIVVQDFDWMQGKKLTDYQINSKDAETGANLTCQVTLHLQNTDGNNEEKNVYYVVGTSPAFSVFRDAR